MIIIQPQGITYNVCQIGGSTPINSNINTDIIYNRFNTLQTILNGNTSFYIMNGLYTTTKYFSNITYIINENINWLLTKNYIKIKEKVSNTTIIVEVTLAGLFANYLKQNNLNREYNARYI